MKNNLAPQAVSEFLGTFFMIFFGCGSMIASEKGMFPAPFIPFIWGGVVSLMIYTLGHISGAHFNPAVSVSFWALKRMNVKKLLAYIFAQFFGALLAGAIHYFIWGSEHSFGATHLNTSLSTAILIEFVISFALMFVITSVATDSRAVGELAGLAIGTSVFLSSFVVGPMTGASMNPARSLAPAIFSAHYGHLAIYLIVPILGAVAGALVYNFMRCEVDTDSSHQGCC